MLPSMTVQQRLTRYGFLAGTSRQWEQKRLKFKNLRANPFPGSKIITSPKRTGFESDNKILANPF
jgi:hypothetical protein